MHLREDIIYVSSAISLSIPRVTSDHIHTWKASLKLFVIPTPKLNNFSHRCIQFYINMRV